MTDSSLDKLRFNGQQLGYKESLTTRDRQYATSFRASVNGADAVSAWKLHGGLAIISYMNHLV